MNGKFFASALVMVAVLSCVLAAPASAVIIDSFNFGNGDPGLGTSFVQATAGGSDSNGEGSLPEVLGGGRSLAIPGALAVTAPIGGNLTVAANGGGGGVLSFSLDALVSGSVVLSYAAAGLPEDLTDAGASQYFSFDINSIDQGGVDLIVSVTDSDTESDSVTLSNAGVGTQQFNFASFAGAIDFDSITAVMLEIQGLDGSDLVLDNFFTSGQIAPPSGGVPEPSTLLMFGLGSLMFGAVGLRRKRNRKS